MLPRTRKRGGSWTSSRFYRQQVIITCKLHQILNIPLAIEVAVQPRRKEEDGSAPWIQSMIQPIVLP